MDITPHNIKKEKTKSKGISLSPKQKKVASVILGVLLAIGLLIGIYCLGYNKGHSKGYKEGETAAKKSNASKSPTDLFNNIQNPFNTTVGVIEKLEGDTLTITTSKGETKTVKVTDKTKITRKKETLNKDALTKGTRVTIMASSKDKDAAATRIVVL